MLLIKNQRIFHNIVTHLINRASTLISWLFLIRSSFIEDFFIFMRSLQYLLSRSHYEKPCS